ncbi:hypothetical protein ACFL3S_10760 [Gemmatimonadota bacterium]
MKLPSRGYWPGFLLVLATTLSLSAVLPQAQLKVVDLAIRKVDTDSQRFGEVRIRLMIANLGTRTDTAQVDVKFLDAEGFEVDSWFMEGGVSAGDTVTLTDVAQVRKPGWNDIRSAKAELW